MASYRAVYRSADGRTLIGGVTFSMSSRFGSRADAEQILRNTIEVNREAGCNCTGEVQRSELPPEIFSHCPGTPPQSIGGRCFGCRKVLTVEDARQYRE